jgi:hypothetical protein
MSPTQIKAVTGGWAILNMVRKQPAVLSEITSGQIASVKDPWSFRLMPTPVLQAMNQAQVNAIPANIYQKANIKGRLTAIQQAWRP